MWADREAKLSRTLGLECVCMCAYVCVCVCVCVVDLGGGGIIISKSLFQGTVTSRLSSHSCNSMCSLLTRLIFRDLTVLIATTDH